MTDPLRLADRFRPSDWARAANGWFGRQTSWLLRRKFASVMSLQELKRGKGVTVPVLGPVAEPRVSIVIPTYGKPHLTWACLESLAQARTRVSFEVVVVDDASPDGAADELAPWTTIELVRNPSNLGFSGACNTGAAVARGTWLCFLNNDTRVTDDWLDELTQTAEDDPQIGIVGSQLLFPDGRLQEAGAMVFRDGSASHFGRNQDPSRPEFNFARDVDYVSGASLLISSALFRQLHGFDTDYSPAYYEDTDLAFRVREAGKRVRYQPLSRVIHYEGMTHGRSEKTGIKRYQVVNRGKFATRWAELLDREHAPAGWRNAATAMRRQALKLLVLSSEPVGAASVQHQLLVALARAGVHVTLYAAGPPCEPNVDADLRRKGVEMFREPFVCSVSDAVAQAGRRGPVTVWVWDERIFADAERACRVHAPAAPFWVFGGPLTAAQQPRARRVSTWQEALELLTASNAGTHPPRSHLGS